jgi:hypothetical protein
MKQEYVSLEEYFQGMWNRWQNNKAHRVHYQHWADAQLSKCHDNVDAYVHACPDCKAVHGAWVQMIGGTDGGFLIAHSLVELPDGEWVDITPLTQQEKDSGVEDPEQRATLTFLEHHGTDEQLRQFCQAVRVPWPPIAIPDAMAADFGSGEGLM